MTEEAKIADDLLINLLNIITAIDVPKTERSAIYTKAIMPFSLYINTAVKSVENKYNAQYKLQLADDKILPKYIVANKEKYKDWFDFQK